jgi:hypothetical protein
MNSKTLTGKFQNRACKEVQNPDSKLIKKNKIKKLKIIIKKKI